jgi:hypothetical protein
MLPGAADPPMILGLAGFATSVGCCATGEGVEKSSGTIRRTTKATNPKASKIAAIRTPRKISYRNFISGLYEKDRPKCLRVSESLSHFHLMRRLRGTPEVGQAILPAAGFQAGLSRLAK